jgi:hypothetical protein
MFSLSQSQANPFASHSSLVNHFLESIYTTSVGRLFDSVHNCWLWVFLVIPNQRTAGFRFLKGKQSQRIIGSGYFIYFKELPTSFQDLVGSSLTFRILFFENCP